MIAISQLRHDTIGRRYYDRKIEQAKTPKEALRVLKRRISDTVYRHLVNDARHLNRSVKVGPGGHPGTTLTPA